jgi:hypothetical protein
MSSAYLAKGLYPEALVQLEKAVALSSGAGSEEKALLAHIYGRMGRTNDARTLVSQLVSGGDTPGYFVALANVGLGDKDSAFAYLDKTVQQRWGPFNELSADPIFDALRSDARFAALLDRIGLPSSTAEPIRVAGRTIE